MMPLFGKKRKAQNYFESGDSEKMIKYVIPYVTEKLLDFNSNPKGNPYVGQDQIGLISLLSIK
jgi:hypothetical protein